MGNYAITHNYFTEMSYNVSILAKLESQEQNSVYKHCSPNSQP